MSKALFPALGRLPAKGEDEPSVELPENATPLEFLEAVYRNPDQPIGRRVTCAIAAAPFRHGKLTVTANADGEFAKKMEELSRQRTPGGNVIDAKANYRTLAGQEPQGKTER